MNLGWGIEGTLPVAVSHSHVTSLLQYRLVPIPRARYDFACASLVFVCILLVHLLVMPRSACDGKMNKSSGVRGVVTMVGPSRNWQGALWLAGRDQ